MEIKPYHNHDFPNLFGLLVNEGEDWADYWRGEGHRQYQKVMSECIGYLAMDENECIGYLRARQDGVYGIYIYDLLVRGDHRGKQIGKQLMEAVKQAHPNQVVYVMSDVDLYYEKLGYLKEGSIYIVK